MRILLFSQELTPGRTGVTTLIRGLVETLGERGHELTVVVPEHVPIGGVRTLAIGRPSVTPAAIEWMALGGRFARVLGREQESHDVALFADAREGWRVRRSAIPIVGIVHDSYALDWALPDWPRALYLDRWRRSLYYRLLRRIERRTYRSFGRLLANSRHVARRVTEGYGLDPRRVEVVVPGLGRQLPTVEAELEGSPAILFVGGNFQRKGLSLLLQAAARLRSGCPDLRVHVVGEDPNRGAFEALAGKLARSPFAVFHGRQPYERVQAMMVGADVFVMPSLVEGFGMVYLEAMRAGTPVIASDRGGLREVFEDGEELLLVDPVDVSGLESAISEIVSDEALSKHLVRKGRAALERCSLQAMAASTESALRKL